MANTVKMKRSAVASKVPTTSDLELGEFAINTYDGKVYIKKDDGTPSIVEVGAGSGGGTPGGSNTQVQFNNSGSFGADADFTFSRFSTGSGTLPAVNVGGAILGYHQLSVGPIYGPGVFFDAVDGYFSGDEFMVTTGVNDGNFYAESNYFGLQSNNVGTGTTTVGFVAPTPDSSSVTYTLTLPKTDGTSDQVLKTDGSGNLSWMTVLTSITSSQITTALGYTPEDSANKGIANGYASLDSGGKVPSAQLPAYVDDVLEYANLAAFPGTGSSGLIYVALDTNKVYRWSGSAYIEISPSPGSTDSVTEGSVNLYYTTARARAAISASGSGVQYNSTTGVISAEGDLEAIAVLSATSGVLRKTAANTWTLDSVLPIANGGTGASSGVAALSNLGGFETTVTANTTTTLTSTSQHRQQFTGTSSQTLVLPDVTTLQLGWTYYILNTSSGFINVQSSGGNAVASVTGNAAAFVTCVATTGTTETSWHYQHAGSRYRTGTGNSVFATSPVLNGSPSITTGTITTSQPVVFTQTWNAGAVTFTGFQANITDTASAAASLLMDLQVGGTRQFGVTKSGVILGRGGGNQSLEMNASTGVLLTVNNTSGNAVSVNLLSTTGDLVSSNGGRTRWSDSGLSVFRDGWLGFSSTSNGTGAHDVIISRKAAANLRFGAADAAAPVAQTLSTQSVVSGTANTAGVDFTIDGSQGTGSAAGGSVIIRTAAAGSASTFTVTFTNGSSTIAGTGLPTTANTPVAFTTTGTLPTNFAINTTYYIRSGSTATAITVSATPGGAAISAASAGTGTHTLTQAAAQNLLVERLRVGPAGQVGLGGANYGSSGQVIMSAGSAAAAAWQTPPGTWTSLGTINTTSGASLSLTGLTLTSYSTLVLVWNGVSLAGTATIQLNDGTSSYTISNNSGNAAHVFDGITFIDLRTGSAAAYGAQTTAGSTYDMQPVSSAAGSTGAKFSFGRTRYSTASTSVTVTCNGSTTFDAGSVTVYGVS